MIEVKAKIDGLALDSTRSASSADAAGTLDNDHLAPGVCKCTGAR
jgi:hypothetical protein